MLVGFIKNNGLFSVNWMQETILDSGVRDQRMLDMWTSSFPLKHKVFTWMCSGGASKCLTS